MPELVALDLPAGPAFVDALRAAWDAGDAVLPVDPRLPVPAVTRLFEALRPTVVVDSGGPHRLPDGRPAGETDALVVATSGTTGTPKGVVLSHDAVRASAEATSSRLGVDPDRDRWLACLPLAHIGGLAVVVRALLTGTPCTVLGGFDPGAVEREARSGATLVSLVATALGRTDASGFRAVLLGGAAPPGGLGPNVVTTYGMTETGSGIVYDGTTIDGAEVRIDAPDRNGSDGRGNSDGGGRVGGEDGVGEVQVRGPMVFHHYRDGTDPRRDGGWFATGDAGRLEADGTLRVFGRIAEVVVSGGEKVWPAPVEQVLSEHPGVAEVAVWKRPDPEWGERVVAWVVPATGVALPSLDELRALVSGQIAPWAAPRELVTVASLPRTPSGKVRRTELH
jgi:O-succinylbenzoic acid--CoA ligase